MEFKFSDSFYVSETDLNRMAYLCINANLNIRDAVNVIVNGWDDADFYTFGFIEDQVHEEVARRIKLYE